VAKAKKILVKLLILFLFPSVLLGSGKAKTVEPLRHDGYVFPFDAPDYVAGGSLKTAACPNFGNDVGFGQITIGIRAGAFTLFDPGSIGLGLGLQIRDRLSRKWSIEVYSDYFKAPILNVGYRTDLRFGVNMLYYCIQRPLLNHKFTPFLLFGISYDDINISSDAVSTYQYENWSPWLNLGYGEQFYLTPRWSVVLEGFYAMPLAIHPVSYLYTRTDFLQILKVKDEGAFTKGGIFVIFSINYTFGNI